MPEGPEIRQAADRVASAIEGQVARRVEFGLPHLARYGEQPQTLHQASPAARPTRIAPTRKPPGPVGLDRHARWNVVS